MTLQASGAISLADVRTELAASGAIALNDTAVRNLAGVSSGAISLSSLYGKSRFSPVNTAIDVEVVTPSVTFGSNGANWGTPLITGIGANYWVKFSTGTGSGTATGSARDTLINLASNVTFGISAAPLGQARTRSGNWWVYTDSAGTNVFSSGTYYFASDRTTG